MDLDPSLIRFHKKFFAGTDVPIDSSKVFMKLLEELNKKNRREKQ